MKREFLKAIEGLSEEAIDKIMAENGKDIEATKSKYSDYESIKTDLKTAQDTIGELEKAKGDTAALQKTIDDYKAADAQREADAKAAAARAGIEARFTTALGERKFAHDYIKGGVLTDFEKALADEANKGRGDVEIFDALTKDKEGIFASQNPLNVNMGGGGGGATSDDAAVRAVMGLPPATNNK